MRADRHISSTADSICDRIVKIYRYQPVLTFTDLKELEKKRSKKQEEILIGIAGTAAVIQVFSKVVIKKWIANYDDSYWLYWKIIAIRNAIVEACDLMHVYTKQKTDTGFDMIVCDWKECATIDGWWYYYETGDHKSIGMAETLVDWLLHFDIPVEKAFDYIHKLYPTSIGPLEDHLSLTK